MISLPIKYNLTKFDILADKIHKLSVNGNVEKAHRKAKTAGKDEDTTKLVAIIVASMSSSYSWQTYKSISMQTDELNSPQVKAEHEYAVRERWKHVGAPDISEIASLNISDSVFYRWLFFNVPKKEHESYKHAWVSLKREFGAKK